MLTRPLLLATAIALLLGGCAYEGSSKLPGVYRIDIQQGNVVDQEMLDQLKPGMDMNQVRYIMGTPVLTEPFHQNRWDYIYSYSEGGKRREQRHVMLFFDGNDKLESIGGDVVPGERPTDDTSLKEPSRTVEVPLKDDNQGIIGTIINAIPFVGDDGPQPKRPTPPPQQQTPAPPTAEPDTSPAP